MKTIKFLSLTVLVGVLFAGEAFAAPRMDKLKASTTKPVQPQATKPSAPTMIAVAAGPQEPVQPTEQAFVPYTAYIGPLEIEVKTPEDEKRALQETQEYNKKQELEREKKETERLQKIAQAISTDVQTLKTAGTEFDKLGNELDETFGYEFRANKLGKRAIGKLIDVITNKTELNQATFNDWKKSLIELAVFLESKKAALITLAGKLEQSPAITTIMKKIEAQIHGKLAPFKGPNERLNSLFNDELTTIQKVATNILDAVIPNLKAFANLVNTHIQYV